MSETSQDELEIEILQTAGVKFPNWNQVANERKYLMLHSEWVFELYGDYKQFFTISLKNLVGFTTPRKKKQFYTIAFTFATPREVTNQDGDLVQSSANFEMYYKSQDNAMQAFEELRQLMVRWERLRGKSPYAPKLNSVTTPAKSAGPKPENRHVSFLERIRKWFRQNIAR